VREEDQKFFYQESKKYASSLKKTNLVDLEGDEREAVTDTIIFSNDFTERMKNSQEIKNSIREEAKNRFKWNVKKSTELRTVDGQPL